MKDLTRVLQSESYLSEYRLYVSITYNAPQQLIHYPRLFPNLQAWPEFRAGRLV